MIWETGLPVKPIPSFGGGVGPYSNLYPVFIFVWCDGLGPVIFGTLVLQHKMKSVLFPVSVEKIHSMRTGFAIRYPAKAWPWSWGTDCPIAQAATDSTVDEITLAFGRLIVLGGGRNSSIQLGRVGKTLALGLFAPLTC